jgi:ribonucleoside-diphosphate reductase alpha chain
MPRFLSILFSLDSFQMSTTDTLPSSYQEFIATSRYSRWLGERRESWSEVVDRFIRYVFDDHLPSKFGFKDKKLKETIRKAILNLEVMPSMRALMTAGPALKRDATCAYNCSYVAIDHPHAFDEILYVLMCGTGVGFSVERQYVAKLPDVPEQLHRCDTKLVVRDSKAGWASSFRQLIALLYAGQIPKWDTSKVRTAGAPLKTMGGRASGPAPLEKLFSFTVQLFQGAIGRKLTSFECHSLICMCGDIVVVGGVRRSALISLSNPSDGRMRHAKSGQWWVDQPYLSLANNSAAYTDLKVDMQLFFDEWKALYESKSGERGIFNRAAAKKHIERVNSLRQAIDAVLRNPSFEWGTNPCSEILLRAMQFCNLSEVVARLEDTEETLMEKVRLATIIGTIQSTFTHFKYLRPKWKKNCEEERLLGVSLTGIMDCPLLNDTVPGLADRLDKLREYAVRVNMEFAAKLGIPPSTAITCVKPSGTVSQLVNASSGIHPRHSKYYIRTVRCDKKDPMYHFLKDVGVPVEDDVMRPDATAVFSFAIQSPEGCLTREDITAIKQLELWKTYATHWCEHKPSITVNVKEHEWFQVGAWVYDNFDMLSGISFLPYSEHVYQQAPYQEVDEKRYLEAKALVPESIDWSGLQRFEKEDHTTSARAYACTGDKCEMVDIV